MEMAFQKPGVTVPSCSMPNRHQRQDEELLPPMFDIHNEADNNSPPYHVLAKIPARPDTCQDYLGASSTIQFIVDQQQSESATIYSPLKTPVSSNTQNMTSPGNKEIHTKSDAIRKKKTKSPSNNIKCMPQLINGVKCLTFTTPDTGRKRTSDRGDGVTKRAKRKLAFPEASDVVKNGDANVEADGKNVFSCQGIEKASTRADRIVTSLHWDVVKVLREATMIKGKDIVLVKPRGLFWAPPLSALRDRDGTLTVLSDSNMAALFQIEDQLNSVFSSPKIPMLSGANLNEGPKETLASNGQEQLIASPDVEKSNAGQPDQRQIGKDTTESDVEIDVSREGRQDHEQPDSLAAKCGLEEGMVQTNFSTGKVLPDLTNPIKSLDSDDEVRVMKAAMRLISEIDISTDQCIDFDAIDHAFEEVDKNLQFIDESKLKCHSFEIDEAVAMLHTDWDQISEKLLGDLESIERRLSLAVAEEKNSQESENAIEIADGEGSQSLINMEIFGDLSFEDDKAYSSLSSNQQQKYLDMLMKEPSIITPYDEIIYEIIDNNNL